MARQPVKEYMFTNVDVQRLRSSRPRGIPLIITILLLVGESLMRSKPCRRAASLDIHTQKEELSLTLCWSLLGLSAFIMYCKLTSKFRIYVSTCGRCPNTTQIILHNFYLSSRSRPLVELRSDFENVWLWANLVYIIDSTFASSSVRTSATTPSSANSQYLRCAAGWSVRVPVVLKRALKFKFHFLAFNRATLVDIIFPRPLIAAQKVSFQRLRIVHHHLLLLRGEILVE